MTWGDIAQDAVRKRGVLYHSDVLDGITAQLPSVAYSAIAAACAERLLSRHVQLPARSQRPFTVTCRRPLDCMWGVLAGDLDSVVLRREVEKWLQSYYDSPLNHRDGQDGPDDADHDPAATFIYAAESLTRDSAESAGYAMSRVVDEAFTRAADDRETRKPATGQGRRLHRRLLSSDRPARVAVAAEYFRFRSDAPTFPCDHHPATRPSER